MVFVCKVTLRSRLMDLTTVVIVIVFAQRLYGKKTSFNHVLGVREKI